MLSPPSPHLPTQKENYNFSLCRTRAVIGRVNRPLKCHFHCLLSDLCVDPGRAFQIILVCVWKDFAVDEEVEQQDTIEEGEEDRDEGDEHNDYTAREPQ